MNATVDAIKNFFKMDPKQLEYYKHSQLEKKAVDLIIENSNVAEKTPDAHETDDEMGAAETPSAEEQPVSEETGE